jgi:tRNA A37 threonylcarbamoyladenosine modification protein TsaB
MRVGIATIQGLALVHDRLVVPVSALDALARGMAHLGRPFVGAWMDAYRGEVFAELYRVDGSTPSDPASLVPPLAAPPHHVVEQWGGALAQATGTRPVAGRSLAVGGDAVAAAAAALRDGFGPEVLLRDAPLLAGTIAAMAASRPEAAVRPHAIAPVYVRRPDAVVGRERRTASPAPPDVAPTR